MMKSPEEVKRGRELIGGGAAIVTIIEAGIALLSLAYGDPQSMLAALGIGLFGAGLTALELHLLEANKEKTQEEAEHPAPPKKIWPDEGPDQFRGIGRGGDVRHDNRDRDGY